jgi:hypothetical protein
VVAINGGNRINSGTGGAAVVPALYRVAAFVALGWAGILMVRALWNCFFDVGVGNFLLGIVYYGATDKAGQAETSSLSYALFYGFGAYFILRGSHWARGLVCGVALVEGYNRLRSLTGALFDQAQRGWFTSSVRGDLLLATFALGLIVSVGLVLMLSRRVTVRVPPQPPVNVWPTATGTSYGAAPLTMPQQFPYQPNPYPQQPPYPPQPVNPPSPYGTAPGGRPHPGPSNPPPGPQG